MDTFQLVLFAGGAIGGAASAGIAIFGDTKRRRQIFIALAFALLAFAGTEAAIGGSVGYYKHFARWIGHAVTFFGLAYAFARATCTRPSTAMITALLAGLSLLIPALCPLMDDYTVKVLLATLGLVVFTITMFYQWSRIVYDDMDGLPIVAKYMVLVLIVYIPWFATWAILFVSPMIEDFIGWEASVLAYNIIDIVAVLLSTIVIAVFGLPNCFMDLPFYSWFVRVQVTATSYKNL